MGKNKSWILWGALGAGLLLLAFGLVFSLKVYQNTKEARAAASEFVSRLSGGELTVVRMKYYAQEIGGGSAAWDVSGDGETAAVTDGDASDASEASAVTFLTPQEMMAYYGEELVMAGREEEAAQQDRFFALVMKYSTLTQKVGMTPGKKGSVTVTLTGPDLKSWADGLSAEEINGMLWADDTEEWLESYLAVGEVPERTLRFRIPMKKVYGNWYFEVTEEMESAFFGGL